MTKNIEINGYVSLTPNTVWSRNLADVTGSNGAPVQTKEVFVALRYEAPFREAVLNLIELTAKDYLAGKYDQVTPEEKIVVDERALAQFFRRFSKEELDAIASRNSGAFKHFADHLPKDIDQAGAKYLRLTTGTVSAQTLEKMPPELKALGTRAYDFALKNYSKDKMLIKIKLQSNNELFDLGGMEYLLKQGVRESNTLSISPQTTDYKQVENKVRALYTALDSAQKVEKLPDLTDAVRLAIAGTTLDQTLKCLEQTSPQMMVIGPEQLDAILGEGFGKINPGKKGGKKYQ